MYNNINEKNLIILNETCYSLICRFKLKYYRKKDILKILEDNNISLNYIELNYFLLRMYKIIEKNRMVKIEEKHKQTSFNSFLSQV